MSTQASAPAAPATTVDNPLLQVSQCSLHFVACMPLFSRSAAPALTDCTDHCCACLQNTVTPAFDKIQAEHVVPGIKTLLAELNEELDNLEKTVQPTWQGLVEPLERLSDRIERTWGAVSHLKVLPLLLLPDWMWCDASLLAHARLACCVAQSHAHLQRLQLPA